MPIRLRVTGRVQGVGFRRFVEARARSLGVGGWVRNVADGAVEVLVDGAPADIATLVADLRRGPPGAVVSDVEQHGAAAGDAAPRPFKVLRD